MGTINIRVNDELKARSFAALEKLGVTPSELVRQTLEYVAQREKLPFKSVPLTSEDEVLIAVAQARLADPEAGVKVSLDDL
ncbi:MULTISPECIES: type II toxin-antitoxin system RelB/DinJ family antitoxin [Gammaproteobacteria]|uniref:Bifunctional antitoxin/transcriptional repressor RelB n=2 Tax=Gammaproteobacteria TaxID=1236 RepID=F5ZFH9_ALTNA|nr:MULTISPECIES: type II toxin-antitoxin system RelB/DinJ family antitoxin [Gammaproteobacteria]AEF05114.1 bifunctional antitoxin/transcriptional repressor RelB [Alteromonas naphthalenivorans]ETI59496.1 bifunctional antitoxin/transcriptional repressor RelB [Marinomonas profundimaris]